MRFLKALKYIEQNIIPSVATLFFAVSFSWMLLEALSRRIFSYSFAISEEVVLFSLMWGILLSLAHGARANAHICIDLIYNRLPSMAKKILSLITLGISIYYCIAILISGWNNVIHLKVMEWLSVSPLELPMWIVMLSIPIGFFLLGSFFIQKIMQELFEFRNKSVKNSSNIT